MHEARMQVLAAALTAVAAAYLAAAIVFIGRRTPGYRHLRHTISELGETGAPHERLVGLGVFLPVGATLLGVAILLFPDARPAAALALCIATGYLVAAFFSCDPGSPVSGSPRQAVHNLGGGVEYVGGGAALMALSTDLGPMYRVLGIVVFAVAALLTLLPATSVRGLVQRIGEVGLFAGLAAAAACMADRA